MMRRPQSELPVAMFSSIQLWTTIAALILAPLFFGSVDLFWIAVWAVLLSISVLCGAAVPMDTGQSRVLFGFFALCGIYTLVAIIQITPHVVDQFNDPSWRQANETFLAWMRRHGFQAVRRCRRLRSGIFCCLRLLS